MIWDIFQGKGLLNPTLIFYTDGRGFYQIRTFQKLRNWHKKSPLKIGTLLHSTITISFRLGFFLFHTLIFIKGIEKLGPWIILCESPQKI